MKNLKVSHSRCQCRACGDYFNSVGAFDKHRTGPYTDRSCLDPDQMRAIGMAENSSGYWVSSLWDREQSNGAY